jgi:hypothetical protein
MYKWDLRFGLIPRIYKPFGQHGSWAGSGWDHLLVFERSPHMHISLSCQHQLGFIKYNPFHSWILWWTILWSDSGLLLPRLLRLRVRRSITYPELRIARYIEISYSILFDGQVMTPLLGNQRIDGLWAVEEFHQRYPGMPGPLENALGEPRV